MNLMKGDDKLLEIKFYFDDRPKGVMPNNF